MLNTLKQLFGLGPKVNYATLVKQGALILDVRSAGEYAGGHIQGSVNIALDVLPKNTSKLKKSQPIIICCASGMRSASAKSILQQQGFNLVYNGGGWSSLQHKIA